MRDIQLVHARFEETVLDATRQQSRLNTLAAAVPAVAALLTGFSVLIGTRWNSAAYEPIAVMTSFELTLENELNVEVQRSNNGWHFVR